MTDRELADLTSRYVVMQPRPDGGFTKFVYTSHDDPLIEYDTMQATDGADEVRWMRDVEASAKPSPIFDGLLTR
jgi:hypothetical protein